MKCTKICEHELNTILFLLQIVDGCITNDGDVFLYGAKTVYRNFTINSKVTLNY